MKLTLIIFTAVLSSAILCPKVETGETYSSDGTRIIIKQKPLDPHGTPRSGDSNPFHAELLDLGVLLTADTDCGDVDVTLSSIEGDYNYTIFDTADGAILLPVYGNVGDYYTITIVTNGGLIFEGDFYL